MDAAERADVRRLLGGGAFVRLAVDDDALLVSDAPRRMDADALAEAIGRLQAEGYVAWVTERGLLAIDWGERRWHIWEERGRICSEPTLPSDETLHAPYALARLLWAHPAPWHEQPRTLLRELVKAAARREGIVRIAPTMLTVCAERLRRHETLPTAAAWLVIHELESSTDGREACP